MSTLTFYNWLMAQRKREGMVGDLARDADGDEVFSRRRSLSGVIAYLRTQHACPGAIRAARKAFVEYERVMREAEALT